MLALRTPSLGFSGLPFILATIHELLFFFSFLFFLSNLLFFLTLAGCLCPCCVTVTFSFLSSAIYDFALWSPIIRGSSNVFWNPTSFYYRALTRPCGSSWLWQKGNVVESDALSNLADVRDI